MGWRGAVRSISAAAKRQARAEEKYQKLLYKQQELIHAHNTVAKSESVVEQIVSLHQECLANCNWHEIIKEPEPERPVNNETHSKPIQQKLEPYRPEFLIRILKLEKWNERRLTEKLAKARSQDEADFQKVLSDYSEALNEWNERNSLAKRLLAGDVHSYMEALQKFFHSKSLPLGKTVEFKGDEKRNVLFDLKVLPYDQIIPSEEYTLRQSGSLSTKKMTKKRGLDLYQDYVCSVLLRVTREVFGVLPIERLFANVILEAVNEQNGKMEDRIIVSALIYRKNLESLNMDGIDPSEATANFKCNMSFNGSKGFGKVTSVYDDASLISD